MTTHSWGKNPRGTWTLEIHNDAYSNCGSEAKFFKWSLKLYGTEMDENSEDLRVGVRLGPIEMEPTTEATTTRRRTTTEKLVRLREKEVVADINCTRTREECRMFKWRRVAKVFCKCTPGLCLDVASHQGGTEFNLQCTMAKKTSTKSRGSSPTTDHRREG